MSIDQYTMRNPLDQYARPNFPKQKQPYPGSGENMDPKHDYGETTYRGAGRLAGRRAIITGGDSGIGRAVALAFAREGSDVLISYFSEDDEAMETCRLIESAERRAVSIRGDLRDEAYCSSARRARGI
jgi:hypothetical protein